MTYEIRENSRSHSGASALSLNFQTYIYCRRARDRCSEAHDTANAELSIYAIRMDLASDHTLDSLANDDFIPPLAGLKNN